MRNNTYISNYLDKPTQKTVETVQLFYDNYTIEELKRPVVGDKVASRIVLIR